MKGKARIVFFGTSNFAVPTLKALLADGYDVVLAITPPDEPSGRNLVLKPCAVKQAAIHLGVRVCDDFKQITSILHEVRPDVGVVVALGKIISKEVLDLFPCGCLNLHPSLLPKYRGPSPIQSAILRGETQTGVSAIKLDEEMDHGPIVGQPKVLAIGNADDALVLSAQLAKLGAELISELLPSYLDGQIHPQPQNDSAASYCAKITKADGQIDWSNDAVQIQRQIRAYLPWPGSFTDFKGKKVEIIKAEAVLEEGGAIGVFQNKNGQLHVRCGKNSLVIKKLKPSGKNEMTAKEFINGYVKD